MFLPVAMALCLIYYLSEIKTTALLLPALLLIVAAVWVYGKLMAFMDTIPVPDGGFAATEKWLYGILDKVASVVMIIMFYMQASEGNTVFGLVAICAAGAACVFCTPTLRKLVFDRK